MADVEVGTKADFKEGMMKRIEVNGKEILIANLGGTLYAIGDTCTHAECSLSEGMLENTIVVCPCHNAQFDVQSGKNVEPPVTGETIDDEPSYKIKVDGNKVFVIV